MDEAEETYDPRRIWWALVRRRAVIVGTALLVAGVALVVSVLQPDRYESTATLLFRDPGVDQRIFDPPILFGGDGLLGGRNVPNSETTIGLVSLDAVAERTAAVLGDKSTEQVSDEITIRKGAGLELIEVTAKTGDPEESAATANAYVRAFLVERRAGDRLVYRRAFRSIERQLEELPVRLQGTAEDLRLRRQLRDLEALQLIQTGDAELVERAGVPTARSSPKPLRNTALAGVTGLILGLLGALLLERIDARLRSSRDFERAYGAPVIASIPELGGGGGDGLPLARLDHEGFRRLWAHLRYMDGSKAPGPVLAVGARAGEGCTTVALGLCRAAAAEGSRVVLVEADMRSSQLAARASVAPMPGLAELLGNEVGERDAIRELPAEGGGEAARPVSLIPAGETLESAAALLAGEPLSELLRHLGGESDLVVVDAPPLGDSSDAIPLFRVCGTVVVVAAFEQPAGDAAGLRRELTELGANVVGVVVTRAR